MVGSLQHEWARWSAELLQPVSHLCSSFCLTDLFQFSQIIRNCDFCSVDKLMASFHIAILFTNAALHETLQNSTDAIYRRHLGSSPIPVNLFLESMHLATEVAEFSFKNIMYAQIDIISMGNPLINPVLTNIFMGFYEHHLTETVYVPTLCE